MSNEITTTKPAPGTDLLADTESFEHAQRVAKMFSQSELIPPQWRGKVADCTIALVLARQLGESPLAVLQSLYVVNGKAGWAASYVIARANRSGVFRGRINWRVAGTGEALVVTAFATLADTGEVVEVSASMAMAKAEGWTSNKKYTSMPEVMLRYRSAVLLVRLYAPEVMLGYHTEDEITDAGPRVELPAPAALPAEIVEQRAERIARKARSYVPSSPAAAESDAREEARREPSYAAFRAEVARTAGIRDDPAEAMVAATTEDVWTALDTATQAECIARLHRTRRS